jgi:Ribosome biogenesis regulatory protein (RRS1)
MARNANPPDDDDIDYGATADMHASDDDDSTAEEEDDPAIEVAVAEDGGDDEEEEASSGSDSDDDQEAIDDNDNEEEEGSGEQDDDEEEDEEEYPSNNNIVVDGGDEPCTFDLRNLLAFNAHPIDTAALYAAPKNGSVDKQPTPERVTIPSVIAVDEKHLYQKAEAGCQQLIAALWQLPTERSDAGPMVKLPSTDDSRVPRALVC